MGRTLCPHRFLSKASKLVILLIGIVLLPPSHSEANTAAGTTITNSVTVTYKDGGGRLQDPESGSVSITVNLVGSVAWGNPPGGQNANSGASLDSAYSVTLRNLGNGSDTFTITDGTNQSSGNLSAGAFSFSPGDEDGVTPGHQIILFGTVSSGAGVHNPGPDTTTIPVGHLTVGDLTPDVTEVRIGSNTYTVAAGSTATQLVVSGNAATDVAAAGVQIGEIVTINYNGTVGNLSNGMTSATHNHQLTATGLGLNGNAPATTDVSWQTTVQLSVLSVTKYVRNVDNPNGNTNGAGATLIIGQTYYTGGVTGNPTETLEYAVVIENTGPGLATDVVMEDTLSSFTSYVGGSVQVDTDGDGVFDALGGTEAHDDGGIVETDTGDAATTTKIKVYAGIGGDETSQAGYGGAGGTIAGDGKSVVVYRVTIK